MNGQRIVYVVGKVIEVSPYASRWVFCGVFSEQREAVKRCGTLAHFVGPATMDSELPAERESWPGAYYPRATEKGGIR